MSKRITNYKPIIEAAYTYEAVRDVALELVEKFNTCLLYTSDAADDA